jgi:hypothetical protein
MKCVRLHISAMPSHQWRPHLHWKFIPSHTPYSEGSPASQPRSGPSFGKNRRASRHRPRPQSCSRSGSRCRRTLRESIWKGSADHRASTHTTLKVSFRKQLPVGIQNRQSRDPKLRCKGPRGRYPLPRMQVSIHDRRPVRVADLFVQRPSTRPIDRDQRDNPRCHSLHLRKE